MKDKIKKILRHPFALILMVFLLIEIGNLTGFSWSKFRYIDKQEIIDAAIRFEYPGIYENARDMAVDYPDFTPKIRYYGSWTHKLDNGVFPKLFGFKSYQVHLLDTIVVVNTNGTALSFQPIGYKVEEPITKNTEAGIYGVIDVDYLKQDNCDDLSVQWVNNKNGKVVKKGCEFLAYAHNAGVDYNYIEIISVKDRFKHEVRPHYGFYLTKVKSERGCTQQRLSRHSFCSQPISNVPTKEIFPLACDGRYDERKQQENLHR